MKEIYKLEIECHQANRNKNGSQASFANGISEIDPGNPKSLPKETVAIIIPDQKLCEGLTPGKIYTITITEKENP